MLRIYKNYKDFFFRLILVSENFEKTHFGSFKDKKVLDYVTEVLKKGIFVGDAPCIVFNYSNSQLKNHSVWMLTKTNIH